MAVELCPDNSSIGMSPRISFSHDFSLTDGVPIEPNSSSSSLLLQSADFDFCIRKSYDYDQESSTADELFSNGVILPAQIKKKPLSSKTLTEKPDSDLPPPQPSDHDKQSHQQQLQRDSKPGSFWGFKRSRSLNCGSISGLCSLPLLSRSKSTGSSSSVKKSLVPKDDRRINNAQRNSSSGIKFSHHQKPPLKKSYGKFSNSSMIVTPVLNVPPANLFGLGSLFSSSKDKTKKK